MNDISVYINKISEVIKKDIDLLDRAGYVIYSSEPSRIGMSIDDFSSPLSIDKKHKLYIHIENGNPEQIALARMILSDREYGGAAESYQQFLINILDGGEALEEECKKYNIAPYGSYIVYCICLSGDGHLNDAYSLILNSFYEDGKAWVLCYGGDIIIVEQVDSISEQIKYNARILKDMINSEVYTDAYIGVGSTQKGIINIKKSLYEAKEAINAGRMLNLPDSIYISKDMLIEKMVSLIPEDKAKALVEQVFKGDLGEIFDSEMKKTVEVFFNTNLNISDSSRILYIHRNTLIYRIDKIQKATGLDIRRFEDAVIFKAGLLLKARGEKK